MELLDFGPHVDAQLRIKVGQRLVEQEDFRLPDKRPAHGNPLPLAARQLRRFPVQKSADLQEFRHFLHRRLAFRLRHLVHFKAKGDVLGDRHVRIERV